jgi:16S rRNA (cytosine967-C5)-methyltransferase
MQRLVLDAAARIIRKADREHPADAVLRSELRDDKRLTPTQRTEISHAVFAYYRWLGWLNTGNPLREQISHATRLAQSFEDGSRKFEDSEVVSRAVPGWLSQTMDVTPPFARALQHRPALWLRARKGQGIQLAAKLGHARVSSNVPDAVEYFGGEDLFKRPEFKEGAFEIQDVSSQLVTRIADPKPGETWWDACAGEGGKTLHLSDLMENKGLIWASDRAAWRLDKLKRRAARAHVFNYRVAPWNGDARLPTKTKFDGVLIDAPCSGVGTWQRNPHARWTTTAKDVHELAGLQKSLLANAASAVKSGGKLVYAVCTMTRAETAEVADWFTETRAEFTPLSADLIRPEETRGIGMFVGTWQRR